ncbi:MAG: diacylglycerol kinase family protein [Caldilineaceae bacterium]
MRERVKIILNPYSGRGAGARTKPRICAALTDAKINFDLAETNGVGHGIELARQAALEGYTTVVAVGGDGTVSEVMNGLAQATPPNKTAGKLAMIPLGSGNDFAAMVGCKRELAHAVQAIASGKSRRIDLGQAIIHSAGQRIERYFDNNMGVGFEAWVTLESYKIKRLSGTLLYVTAALRALNSYQPPHINLAWEAPDGVKHERHDKTLMVSIGNSRRTGGGFYLTPDARLDDGLLDIAIADAIPPSRTLLLLPRALLGKHTSDKAITMSRCRALQITCPTGLPVQLDGEVVAQQADQVEIRIHPKRLEVIV